MFAKIIVIFNILTLENACQFIGHLLKSFIIAEIKVQNQTNLVFNLEIKAYLGLAGINSDKAETNLCPTIFLLYENFVILLS